jgi:hypothetical protein
MHRLWQSWLRPNGSCGNISKRELLLQRRQGADQPGFFVVKYVNAKWGLFRVQFFTMQWWSGIQAGGDDPVPRYAAHLAAIRDRLPMELLTIVETVSLHDARLRELRLAVNDGMLSIELDSYAADERFALLYSKVSRFESSADPKLGLRGPAGYGDLGYDEVDVLPDGAFEHRLLFSSGIELAVAFRAFRLQRDKCAL